MQHTDYGAVIKSVTEGSYIPRPVERGEIRFPFGEVVEASGLNFRFIHILRNSSVISRLALAKQVWAREINHSNSFLRISPQEAAYQGSYLPTSVRAVKGLIPARYEVGEIEKVLFLIEKTWYASQEDFSKQMSYLEKSGLPENLRLSPNQYRQTFPAIMDTFPPIIRGHQTTSVLVEPRGPIRPQLDDLEVVPESDGSSEEKLLIKANGSLEQSVIVRHPYEEMIDIVSAIKTPHQPDIPYTLWVYNGMEYSSAGYQLYKRLKSANERPLTFLEGISYLRAVRVLGEQVMPEFRMVMAGSFIQPDPANLRRIEFPYFHFLFKQIRLSFISRQSTYLNFGFASTLALK